MILHLSRMHINVNWKVYNDRKNVSATMVQFMDVCMITLMYKYVGSGEKVMSRNGSVGTAVSVTETEDQDPWDRDGEVFTMTGSRQDGENTSEQTGIPCYIPWCGVGQ